MVVAAVGDWLKKVVVVVAVVENCGFVECLKLVAVVVVDDFEIFVVFVVVDVVVEIVVVDVVVEIVVVVDVDVLVVAEKVDLKIHD